LGERGKGEGIEGWGIVKEIIEMICFLEIDAYYELF
jgi:hypothetical protein